MNDQVAAFRCEGDPVSAFLQPEPPWPYQCGIWSWRIETNPAPAGSSVNRSDHSRTQVPRSFRPVTAFKKVGEIKKVSPGFSRKAYHAVRARKRASVRSMDSSNSAKTSSREQVRPAATSRPLCSMSAISFVSLGADGREASGIVVVAAVHGPCSCPGGAPVRSRSTRTCTPPVSLTPYRAKASRSALSRSFSTKKVACDAPAYSFSSACGIMATAALAETSIGTV